MTKYYRFESDGGFLCGDDATGLTSYAYPRSAYANRAQMSPDIIVGKMLAGEQTLEDTPEAFALRTKAERLHKIRLFELRQFGTPLPDAEGA